MVTSFRVVPEPGGQATMVTISTVMPRRWGPVGWVEERIVRRLLSRVFAEELDLVTAYLAGVEPDGELLTGVCGGPAAVHLPGSGSIL